MLLVRFELIFSYTQLKRFLLSTSRLCSYIWLTRGVHRVLYSSLKTDALCVGPAERVDVLERVFSVSFNSTQPDTF